jgi:hypothetical protein
VYNPKNHYAREKFLKKSESEHCKKTFMANLGGGNAEQRTDKKEYRPKAIGSMLGGEK